MLVDAANQIQVSDFGFAVRLEETNLASLLAGTPAFMAPEQIDSCWGEISPRTDIWGLGSVLYFLLYGRPPHDGGDVPSTLARAVARQPVLFPKKGEVLIPVSVCEILKRCLNKDLDQRFESARSLATALNHASDSLQG